MPGSARRRQRRPHAASRKAPRGHPDMTQDFPAGNYRFIPAVFQYSSGAAASPGFEVERVRFDKMLPLAEGFAQIAKYIEDGGTAADLVLRLRAALAGGVHRGRLPRNSTSTTSRRWRNGACSTAQPIRWRAATSVRRSIRRPSRRSMRSRSRARAATPRRRFVIAGGAESRERTRQLSRAHRALPRPQPGRLEGEGAVHRCDRWKAVSARSALAGRTPRRCRPTPCTISIR